MLSSDYPFAKQLIIDEQGNISQIILDFDDYQRFLEIIEDEGLYKAMQETKDEIPLSLKDALTELEKE